MSSAISSVSVARGNDKRWEDVATARSYMSKDAASAYTSKGYKGALESNKANVGAEGMILAFGEIP
jgi:hypothetical protein